MYGGVAPVVLYLWTLDRDKWLAAGCYRFVSWVSALDYNWTGDWMGTSAGLTQWREVSPPLPSPTGIEPRYPVLKPVV